MKMHEITKNWIKMQKVSHPTLQPPLFKYAPSWMLHINQSWCTPWPDVIDPTILRLRAEGIKFLWWINSMIINTQWQGTIIFLNKENRATSWRFKMLNETIFKIFINVFTKSCKFVLWQVVDRSKWRSMCSLLKSNGTNIWTML
jgi:hypothetical protein